jgi:hypothetical protein
MNAEISVRHRAEFHSRSESCRPETLSRLESIFNAVWGELRCHPEGETIKEEVAERVVMYSNSGLLDAERIKLAVLNSFGRSG